MKKQHFFAILSYIGKKDPHNFFFSKIKFYYLFIYGNSNFTRIHLSLCFHLLNQTKLKVSYCLQDCENKMVKLLLQSKALNFFSKGLQCNINSYIATWEDKYMLGFKSLKILNLILFNSYTSFASDKENILGKDYIHTKMVYGVILQFHISYLKIYQFSIEYFRI